MASLHGAGTTVDLTLTTSADADVTVKPTSASFSLDAGKSVTTDFTASAISTLTPGTYSRTVGLTAFGGAYSLSTSVSITVVQPYYFIKSQLGNVIEVASGSGMGLSANAQKAGDDDQLWNFVLDPAGSGYYYIVSKSNGKRDRDLRELLKTAGVLLGVAKKTAVDDQLWCFVSDPGKSGDCFIVSKLNGNVIDIQGNATAGALDAFPVKPTGNNNQLWSVVGSAFPSTLSAQLPPVGLGNGNVNYFLGGGGAALTGVSAKVDFSNDFISSAGGYSFQLNGYSTDPEATKWQQFVIYAAPGSNQLMATVQTWSGTAAGDWINNIHTSLANLSTSTIPKGYSFTIVLSYYNAGGSDGYSDPSALISGATFTVDDNKGNVVGTTNIGILGRYDGRATSRRQSRTWRRSPPSSSASAATITLPLPTLPAAPEQLPVRPRRVSPPRVPSLPILTSTTLAQGRDANVLFGQDPGGRGLVRRTTSLACRLFSRSRQ